MTKNKKDKSIHSGHRERMRARFHASEGSGLADHELLEMLLYYPMPRKNTNDLAHRLINEFGSLGGVLNADRERLGNITGVGESTAFFFELLREVQKRKTMQKYQGKRFSADSLSNVGNYFVDYFKGKRHEEFCVMLLNNSLKMTDFKVLSSGSINCTSVDTQGLAKYALDRQAAYAIIAHNHPAGALAPSTKDTDITYDVSAALNAIGVTLMEHIIVNDISYIPTMQSMKKRYFGNTDPNLLKNFYRK